MGTLASQADIGVWVQAPGRLWWSGGGYHPQKSLEITYAQHPAIWCFSGRKTVRSAVHNAFESL